MLRKLLMIVFGIFLVLAAGSCNIYPLYLKQMMDKFGYTLKEVNLYGSFINLGLWVAFTMGMIYDKFGPKVSCTLGAIILPGSYAVLHMIMNSELKSLSLFPMLLLAIIMGQGSALCYTTAVTTNLKNFNSNNSAIVGLLVTNMALSPSLFTLYREALPNVKMAEYFLIISVFLAIVILACGWVFTNIKDLYSEHEKLKGYETYKEKKIIRLLVLLNILILIIYIFGVIFNNLNSENRFPNAIIYPCLQTLNFLFIIFEKFGIWEKLYFREFIEKEIRRKFELQGENWNANWNINNNVEKENSNFGSNNPPVPLEEEKSEDVSKNIEENSNKIIELSKKEVGINNTEEVEKDIDLEKNLEKNTNQNIPNPQPNIQNINVNINNIIQINIKEEDKSIEDQFKKEVKVMTRRPQSPKSPSIKLRDLNINRGIEKINYERMNLSYGGEEIAKKQIRSFFEIENDNINHPNNEKNNPLSEIKLEKRVGCIEEVERTSKIEDNLPVIAQDLGLNQDRSEFQKFCILISTKEVSLLFTMLILGIGSAIANLNNIQFIVGSIKMNPTSKEIFEYAILYFAFNSFTRIISVVTSIVGLISQALGQTMDKDLLFFSIGLAGATHGGYMTFTPIYTRQFGLENMGKVLGFLTTGAAIGSILVADLLFTISYDEHTPKDSDKCFGTDCFANAYLMTSIFFFINTLISLYLLHLNKKKISSN